MNMPNERAIGLLGNHRTICRFVTSDDGVLQTVMRRILTVAQSVLDAPSWNLAEVFFPNPVTKAVVTNIIDSSTNHSPGLVVGMRKL